MHEKLKKAIRTRIGRLNHGIAMVGDQIDPFNADPELESELGDLRDRRDFYKSLLETTEGDE